MEYLFLSQFFLDWCKKNPTFKFRMEVGEEYNDESFTMRIRGRTFQRGFELFYVPGKEGKLKFKAQWWSNDGYTKVIDHERKPFPSEAENLQETAEWFVVLLEKYKSGKERE